jgi:hypothetical protein
VNLLKRKLYKNGVSEIATSSHYVLTAAGRTVRRTN